MTNLFTDFMPLTPVFGIPAQSHAELYRINWYNSWKRVLFCNYILYQM